VEKGCRIRFVNAYSGPGFAALRRNLAALIAKGLVPYNVAEKGQDLLSLSVVSSRVHLNGHGPDDEDAREAASAAALASVLEEAIASARIGRTNRRVLKNVLPLRDDLAGKSVEERRNAAGEDIKGDSRVSPGTIRTYYEPKALNALAVALVEMEAAYRGEQFPEDALPAV
jgi:hypothetical protein